MVALATTLSINPKVLVLDDPTCFLDESKKDNLYKLIKLMKLKYNKTIVIVTHNSNIAEIADKIIRVRSGKIQSIEKNDNPKNVDEVEW